MENLKRIVLTTIVVILALIPAASVEGAAEKVIMICGHSSTETSSAHQLYTIFRDYVHANTDEIEVEIYPMGQLGNDRELAESCYEGSIQSAAMTAAAYVNYTKDAYVFDIPYAIGTNEEIEALIHDPEFLTAFGKSFEAINLKIGLFNNGYFRAITSKKPVRHIDDFKGLKMRVMDNEIQVAMFKSLGCTTTIVPFPELYTALQQGLVEAQDNSFKITFLNKLYEPSKYATQTFHKTDIGVYTMNMDWFNALTPTQQKVIMDAWKHTDENRPSTQTEELGILEELRNKYNYEVFAFTPEDIAKGRELCQPVWEMIKKEVNTEVYDSFLNAIEKARKQ